jgi:ABC-type multidrug transport system fused ATPase/permease subunit
LVNASLQDLKGSLTLFMVSHRLSALTFCDRVMVIESGRVTAFDAPSGLASTSSYFHEVSEITRQQHEAGA